MGVTAHAWRVEGSGVGEVSRGEKVLYSGTDPESYITEYTSVFEEYRSSGARLLKESSGLIASERRGNKLKGDEDFYLKAMALTVLYVPYSLVSGFCECIVSVLTVCRGTSGPRRHSVSLRSSV